MRDLHLIRLTASTADTIIPYVLIEEKSAWDVLQNIAEFCCAYIYCDRHGRVIIEEDDFRTYSSVSSDSFRVKGVCQSSAVCVAAAKSVLGVTTLVGKEFDITSMQRQATEDEVYEQLARIGSHRVK